MLIGPACSCVRVRERKAASNAAKCPETNTHNTQHTHTHTQTGIIQKDCVQNEYAGWVYFLYGLHHIVPTSLFLVPLSLTVDQMLTDENIGQTVLEGKHTALVQSQRLLEAMVPKSIAQRLRAGHKYVILFSKHDDDAFGVSYGSLCGHHCAGIWH
jgi:hypothetical protein